MSDDRPRDELTTEQQRDMGISRDIVDVRAGGVRFLTSEIEIRR